jgi:hypothetical protein
MMSLDEIVKEMLETHVGGEKFFDNLDANIQRTTIIEKLFWKIPYNANIIASGNFGMVFNNVVACKRCLLVPGSLRKGRLLDLSYLGNYIENMSFTFIDDSFYSGKTRDVIKAEVERLGGKLIHTYAIYDGSKEKDPNVSSLYRYYDNH